MGKGNNLAQAIESYQKDEMLVSQFIELYKNSAPFNNHTDFYRLLKDNGYVTKQAYQRGKFEPVIDRLLTLREKDNDKWHNIHQIAALAGVSHTTVYNYAKENGFETSRGRPPVHKKLNIDVDEVIDDYYVKELTLAEIAEKHRGERDAGLGSSLINSIGLPSRTEVKSGDATFNNVEWDDFDTTESELEDIMSELVGEEEEEEKEEKDEGDKEVTA